MSEGAIVVLVVAVLITVCASVVVYKTSKGKPRNWAIFLVLFFLLGIIPAIVYAVVTVAPVVYVLAPAQTEPTAALEKGHAHVQPAAVTATAPATAPAKTAQH
jgi:predicted PurR-regulated permease PerM